MRLEVHHHADSDVLCAVISAFVCTLAGAAELNAEAKCVYSKLDYGSSVVQYIAQGETAEEDMRIILLGLLQLETQYPDSVKVEQNIFE